MLAFNENLTGYIGAGGNKILTTYDSLRKIMEVLGQFGEDISEWVVVIDEFQAIFFDDCQYKATTEYELCQILELHCHLFVGYALSGILSGHDGTVQEYDHL